MAVGIEQIAGPVNAGDIIMRDEEAPRSTKKRREVPGTTKNQQET